MVHYSLKPFETPPEPFSLIVDSLTEKSELYLNFVLTGDIEPLNLPRPSELPRRIEGLYHHTCFEVFIKRGKRYLEWNFSLAGDWCLFLFDDYRKKSDLNIPLDSSFFNITQISQSPKMANLKVSIPLDKLEFLGIGPFQIGLSAVIEHPKGILSYWSLEHRDKHPNFHHPDSFIGKL